MPGPTRVIGIAGTSAARDAALLDQLERPDIEVVSDALALRATGNCTAGGPPEARRVQWSTHPLQDDRASHATGAESDAALVATDPSGAVELRTDVSAAAPLYCELLPDKVRFATRLRPLAMAGGHELRPDWDAWAHILTTGGPLGGRTPFRGLTRLCPGQHVEVPAGDAPRLVEGSWRWLEAGGPATGSVAEVLEALEAEVGTLAERSCLGSMLSGGWDSRVLATLAASASANRETRAWTTSSDTGTSLEELVAAKVAERLGLPHTIVPAPHDRFGSDLGRYGRLVDHQSSFHVWAVPLADALRDQGVTVLDGLGGGIFLDDAFAEGEGAAPSRDQRFARLARYLEGAVGVLRPEVVSQLRERTRTAYDAIVAPLDDHPHGRAFTAYLTRTFPGISHGPLSLIGDATAVAVPFLDDEVVRAALALPEGERSGGALYRSLLRRLFPELAELPTASALTGPRRQLPRRGASEMAARVYRDLLTREPVSMLLDPELLQADLPIWQRHLSRTRQQHLIRGVAVLSLWLEEYRDHLGSVDIDDLLVPVG